MRCTPVPSTGYSISVGLHIQYCASHKAICWTVVEIHFTLEDIVIALPCAGV